jgi:luciferase family oxidoreductase group 1
MQFGMFDEVNAVAGRTPAQVYDDHLRQIVLSEELGFTSYWFAEHHFDTYRMAPHPNLLIAAAARETSRLQLGNMVTVLPFHNPVRVAEEQAMLDHLTDGRLQVGIGRGVQPPEFRRLHVAMQESRQMFEESYEALVQLWTAPPATYAGRYWSYEDVTLMPAPLQKPHPPLWVAGLSEHSARWTAARGLPYVTIFQTPDEFGQMASGYRAAYRPSPQFAAPCVGISRHVYVAETDARAREEVGFVYNRLFRHWLDVALVDDSIVDASYKPNQQMHARLGRMNLDELLAEGYLIFGSPETCRRQVADLARRGADVLLAWMSPHDVPPALVAKSLALFAREVMPAFAPVSP